MGHLIRVCLVWPETTTPTMLPYLSYQVIVQLACMMSCGLSHHLSTGFVRMLASDLETSTGATSSRTSWTSLVLLSDHNVGVLIFTKTWLTSAGQTLYQPPAGVSLTWGRLRTSRLPFCSWAEISEFSVLDFLPSQCNLQHLPLYQVKIHSSHIMSKLWPTFRLIRLVDWALSKVRWLVSHWRGIISWWLLKCQSSLFWICFIKAQLNCLR